MGFFYKKLKKSGRMHYTSARLSFFPSLLITVTAMSSHLVSEHQRAVGGINGDGFLARHLIGENLL